MIKTIIDWPGLTHTWNPVHGCRRGCFYCYASKIDGRFNRDFTNITYYPEKLKEASPKQKPRVIFVGSASDPEYWKPEWWEAILDTCRKCPQHTFMFLTKGIRQYWSLSFPDNCILGITITCIDEEPDRLTNYMSPYHKRGFISIEPLLGKYLWSYLALSGKWCELVICGPMTGPGAIIPKPEWIESVRRNVPPEKLYWKKSMLPYIGYSGFESQRKDTPCI
jgi:protein gp37